MVNNDEININNANDIDMNNNDNTINNNDIINKEINDLNNELISKNNEISKLKSQLMEEHNNFQNRIANIVADKNKLLTELNHYKLIELDLQVAKFEKLKIDYLKLEHRYGITKKLLDDSRSQVAILEKVIYDLENIKFIEFIKNNEPNSFTKYKEDFRKEIIDEL